MNKVERQGIARLIEVFGADILVSLPEHVPLSRIARATLRFAVTEQVTECTLCPLHMGCHGPIPPHWPADSLLTRAQVTVVVESPTEDDDNKRVVLQGRVGKTIRGGLAQAGLNTDDYAFTFVTACRSHTEQVQRPPSAREAAFCRANLLAAIDAADARYVLLFGASAVRAWRDDLKVSQVAGKLFLWGNRFVWPMWSVQAVLRDAYPGELWRNQLAQFAQIVADDAGLDALHMRCVECNETVYGYDANGVPWCRKHLPIHIGAAASRQAREAKHQVNQLTMGTGTET